MADSDEDERRPGEVDFVAALQQALDGIQGNHVLLLPLRDDSGEIGDYRIVAASPGTLDAFGRLGVEIIGSRLREDYGAAVRGPVWHEFRDAFTDDEPRTVGPFPFPNSDSDLPPAQFTATLRRVGPGMLNSWTRTDDIGRPEERIARTERLANLGWAERDMLTGITVWSDQLYRIFERDPAAGPADDEEFEALTVPDDRPRYRRAVERLGSGRPVDLTFRIRVPSGVKYVRVVTETVFDVRGRALRVIGILQDITARVTSGTRLARVQRELSENQESLAAENRLVAELQQIILPIPVTPVDLPGLRMAVRYLPAEQANRIGGDWFHAGAALDDSVIIAVGDVAGHGIRAAATMAKLRHAFATLVATATSDPAELLVHLNRLMHANVEPTDIASAVVARYDPYRSILTWAQAGHPAPLRTRAGATTELDRPAGVMLGVVAEPVYETKEVSVHPGDLLVLFTDGLIERRDQSLDDGLRPVIATLNRLSARRSPQPLADLLAQLDRANPHDDTCILAMRPLPFREVAEQPAPAEQLGSPDLNGTLDPSPAPQVRPVVSQRS